MTKPRVVLAASLWTLEGHPTPAREWSLDRKLRAIASEGFDAVIGPVQEGLGAKLKAHGQRYAGVGAAESLEEFRTLLQRNGAEGAESFTVQIRPATLAPGAALQRTRQFFREAARQRIPLAVETHRGTITESPEGLLALAEGYAQAEGAPLPLTWDPSHLAVVRHLKPFQFSEVLLARTDLIQASAFFHCRPFNGQHAQVPLHTAAGRLTPEGRDWLKFQEDMLRCWLAGNPGPRELWLCPEIGPVGVHGYNLSTMPASWLQACATQRELRRLWRKITAPK